MKLQGYRDNVFFFTEWSLWLCFVAVDKVIIVLSKIQLKFYSKKLLTKTEIDVQMSIFILS